MNLATKFLKVLQLLQARLQPLSKKVLLSRRIKGADGVFPGRIRSSKTLRLCELLPISKIFSLFRGGRTL